MMEVRSLFDARTSTLTYVVFDPQTRDAVVIDPVLDYDPAAGNTWPESTEAVIRVLNENRLHINYVLETHAHADHLSGAQVLKDACPRARLAIGSRIVEVQRTFKGLLGLPAEIATNQSFDALLEDGQRLLAGSLTVDVLATPGHTPACVTYRIGDALFTGDALFMPDSGTGRCDFPGGSARDLHRSITTKIYGHPDSTRVLVGHDYQPKGRPLAFETTVGEEKRHNVALSGSTTEEEFVAFREARDATLPAPRLLFQSVQVNVDGGRLPPFLRMPLNLFKARPQQPAIPLEYCEPVVVSGAQG